MPKQPESPFTETEFREMPLVITKIQEACDTPGLLVLDPSEARLLRKLLHYLRHRPNPPIK